jgi:hypothetical protein
MIAGQWGLNLFCSYGFFYYIKKDLPLVYSGGINHGRT